jgi:cytochrome c oxidase assembly protein subunit 15
LKTAISSFNKLSLVTLIAVYFLIFVGGVVRSSGSGMGCPDWPKCFGNWIPPTSLNQLPADYKEKYALNRGKKNKKFASLLKFLGFSDTAQQLMNDKTVLVEEDFNATKTWIEYLNRLVGIVIGFLIALLFWKSLKLIKVKPQLFVIASITLLGIMFQGWFGSIVVSTNLTTWTITVHMFLALVIIFLLILTYEKSRGDATFQLDINPLNLLLISCIASILIQILFGTQVREQIDKLSASLSRVHWIANLRVEFILHRSFSWIVLFLHIALIIHLRRTKKLGYLSTLLIGLVIIAIGSGAVMAYFSIPSYIQPLHLLLATLIFGIQILLFLKLNTQQPSAVIP